MKLGQENSGLDTNLLVFIIVQKRSGKCRDIPFPSRQLQRRWVRQYHDSSSRPMV